MTQSNQEILNMEKVFRSDKTFFETLFMLRKFHPDFIHFLNFHVDENKKSLSQNYIKTKFH